MAGARTQAEATTRREAQTPKRRGRGGGEATVAGDGVRGGKGFVELRRRRTDRSRREMNENEGVGWVRGTVKGNRICGPSLSVEI